MPLTKLNPGQMVVAVVTDSVITVSYRRERADISVGGWIIGGHDRVSVPNRNPRLVMERRNYPLIDRPKFSLLAEVSGKRQYVGAGSWVVTYPAWPFVARRSQVVYLRLNGRPSAVEKPTGQITVSYVVVPISSGALAKAS